MKDPNRPEDRRRSRVKSPSTPIIKAEAAVEKPKNSQNRSKKQVNDPAEDLSARCYRRRWWGNRTPRA